MIKSVALAAVQGRVADRSPGMMVGSGLLMHGLAELLGILPDYFGNPGTPQICSWQDDLKAAGPLLDTVAVFVERALTSHQIPVLCLNQCAASLATLPILARRRPDVSVLWLDAHGDFNTPETTTTGYLNGLPLAGACGYWNTGFGGELQTKRLVLVGGRDFDPPELDLMTRIGVTLIPPGPNCISLVLAALGDASVYVHLDWDVLEPGYIPAEYQVPGGLLPAELQSLLKAVIAGREVVGFELAEFDAPENHVAQQEAVCAALEVISPITRYLMP